MFRLFKVIIAVFALSTSSSLADYPEREVLGVVMWGAGGATDTVARAINPAAEIPAGIKSTSPPSIAVKPGPSPPKGIALTSKSVAFEIKAAIVDGNPPGPVDPILILPGFALISFNKSERVLYFEFDGTAITATPLPKILIGYISP